MNTFNHLVEYLSRAHLDFGELRRWLDEFWNDALEAFRREIEAHPPFTSEVEVNFIVEGAGQTRFELEHRNFERMGIELATGCITTSTTVGPVC